MHVRKFCACGVKLERVVADEDSARRVVEAFRLDHSGEGHGPITGYQYLKLIRTIIRRNAAHKGVVKLTQPRLRTFTVIEGGKK